VKTDFTKARKSKSVQVCPECNKKGQIRRNFLITNYYHVVDNGSLFRHVKEYCAVPNIPEREFYYAIKAGFKTVPTLEKSIPYLQNEIWKSFRKGEKPEVMIASIAQNWINKHRGEIIRLNTSIGKLEDIIRELPKS